MGGEGGGVYENNSGKERKSMMFKEIADVALGKKLSEQMKLFEEAP